jgi:hypothetical protein
MEEGRDAVFGLPQDKRVLEALGAVSIRHGQLDYILRMTVCSIAGVSKDVALNATARQGSGDLRDRIRKLAKRRFGESETLVLLDALLTRARCASERRNELIHSLWARELDGDALVADEDHRLLPAPNPADIDAIANEIDAITYELIKARQDGFLYIASKKLD